MNPKLNMQSRVFLLTTGTHGLTVGIYSDISMHKCPTYKSLFNIQSKPEFIKAIFS